MCFGVRKHQPEARERSWGCLGSRLDRSFSFPTGTGFYLPHREEKTVGGGLVEVKAEMKKHTKSTDCCWTEMGRRGGNFHGIILGNIC